MIELAAQAREAEADRIVAEARDSVEYWDGDPDVWINLRKSILEALQRAFDEKATRVPDSTKTAD